MVYSVMKKYVHPVALRPARRDGALWPWMRTQSALWSVAFGLAIAIFNPVVAVAHPMHSEAIQRSCELRQADNKAATIKGECSFLSTAGYLIFELSSIQDTEATGPTVSGVININQLSGTVFQTDSGPLVNGALTLADNSPEVVNMNPGELAAWDNGYVLEVSGTPTKADGSPVLVAQTNTETLSEVFVNYIKLGFVHILPLGFDHILFVIGLFLFSPKLKPLLWQVSAFTLAHTITLALGASGLVRLAPSLVEPLIALSIVWIAVENLLHNGLNRWRLGVIFCFGLLHGFGFAGVLLDIGLSGAHFYSALLAFNVGVELGQLAVIALCFLVVGWMMAKPVYQGRVVAPASLVIALIGAYWMVERIGLV